MARELWAEVFGHMGRKSPRRASSLQFIALLYVPMGLECGPREVLYWEEETSQHRLWSSTIKELRPWRHFRDVDSWWVCTTSFDLCMPTGPKGYLWRQPWILRDYVSLFLILAPSNGHSEWKLKFIVNMENVGKCFFLVDLSLHLKVNCTWLLPLYVRSWS